MPIRVAIPMPHSGDLEYAERSIPQYEQAVQAAGGEAVRIPLDLDSSAIAKMVEQCDAVLLPGSGADVDPAKYHAKPHPKTEAADLKRDAVDDLLLQDAYKKRKPILGICYGLQILNVHRNGTLLQHIESQINHAAGRKVLEAHVVKVDPESKLGTIVDRRSLRSPGSSGPVTSGAGGLKNEKRGLAIPVNSSHHQAADVVGDGLRVVARCPEDGIIEALEGTSSDHFVLAVQWHPERSSDNAASRAIFRALIEAAKLKSPALP
ncbi:MAG: gamma-glutamyl-gamma-aminobutyrate hydrolase family protein [Acidobacteriota bacterium]|jgi:putative glutamine amidotransferase|nr:gamma-glutamyl-gamma-aminobutyrate hydrolase family protein [Acidobacteriota bacterium]